MHSCRSNSNRSRSRLVLAATVVILSAACSEPQFSLPTSPSDGDTTSTATTTATSTDPQTFSGTLTVRGQRFYSFTVPSTRTIRITLEQLHDGAGTASTATLVLGLGAPSGTGCALLHEVAVRASDAPHIDESLATGVYCAQLTDPGTLSDAVIFSVRIEFPETAASALATAGNSQRVSNSSHGDNQEAVLAKLASQVADMHVERPILATEFAVEHFQGQTLAFDDRAGRLDEAGHDFVFLRREVEWHVVQVDLATGLMTGDSGNRAKHG